jgi:hypothetical protein
MGLHEAAACPGFVPDSEEHPRFFRGAEAADRRRSLLHLLVARRDAGRVQHVLARSAALVLVSAPVSNQLLLRIVFLKSIEPAPQRRRQTTWHTFLKAHWDVLAAVDFTTVEVWTKNGLITFYLLVVMELATP